MRLRSSRVSRVLGGAIADVVKRRVVAGGPLREDVE